MDEFSFLVGTSTIRDHKVSNKPLLLGDTFIRFANGMAYIFFVLAITQYHGSKPRSPAVNRGDAD